MVMVVTGLTSSLGTPLIPQIVHSYGVSLASAQWVLTISMLVGAVASPIIGRLATPARRRGLLLGVLGVVCLGLLLSTLPFGFAALLIGRAMQGLGIALAPVVMSIARSELPAEKILPAIAGLSASALAAAGISFPVASLMAGLGGVPAAYLTGLALSVGCLVFVWFAIPRSKEQTPSTRIDWIGAVLLSGGVGGLLVLLSELRQWEPWLVLIIGLAALMLMVGWAFWSLNATHPLIDLRLAMKPGVRLANLLVIVSGTGTFLMIPLVMLAGSDARAAGLPFHFTGFLLIPYSIMSVGGSRLGVMLQRRLQITRAFALDLGHTVKWF